jgi:asparagine synthase (glutamine-hydrolysing)
MCGIVGFVLFQKKLESIDYHKKINDMTNLLKRRGPDKSGVWINSKKNVFLGHRRLSIIDFSQNANQPMISFNKKWIVSYNGEIYNFKKLKRLIHTNIEEKNSSHGDTWVLVNLFEKFGYHQTINMLEGMFAISAYEIENNKLYLSRDRFGEKPLYYFHNKNFFVFGSELKVFKNFHEIDFKISELSIIDYFRFNYIPSPNSIYKDIFKLKPGASIELDIHTSKKKFNVFWKYNNPKTEKLIYKDIIDKTNQILNETIKNELVSDAELGCFLSGGTDSTLVASIASSQKKKLKTFTLKNNDYQFDESNFAKKVASYLNTDHREFEIGKQDLLDSFFRMKDIYDEPFGDSSQIPTYLISKYTKNYVKVALTGDGGDEIFLGYKRYKYFYSYWSKVNKTPFMIRKKFSDLTNMISPNFYDQFFYYLSKFSFERINYYNMGYSIKKFSDLITKKNFNDSFYSLIENKIDSKLLFKNYKVEIKDIPVCNLSDAIMHDLVNYLPDDILCKVDRASMYNSLETRSPFLNHKIFNYMNTISIDQKMNKGVPKSILKDILKIYLPEDLINKNKRGFSIPIANWLKKDFKHILDLYSSKNYLEEQNIFNSAYIKNIIEEYMLGNKSYEKFLWSFIIFQDWYLANKY